MSPLFLLRKLGLYIDEQFLTHKECQELSEEMAHSQKTTGQVYSEESETEYSDLQLRQTQTCHVSLQSHDRIASRILTIKPLLEEHFKEQYSSAWETPKFLQYKTGNYFKPHTDAQACRRLNLSIYLNNQSANQTPGSYCGGELTLYGLIQSPGWQKRGMTVPGIQGMLIAYPVDILHEVTPVEFGSRYAIVSRFLSLSVKA